MKDKIEISIEKLFPSGDLLCSAIIDDRYLKFRYSGYTKKEARQEFREYLKNEIKQ